MILPPKVSRSIWEICTTQPTDEIAKRCQTKDKLGPLDFEAKMPIKSEYSALATDNCRLVCIFTEGLSPAPRRGPPIGTLDNELARY